MSLWGRRWVGWTREEVGVVRHTMGVLCKIYEEKSRGSFANFEHGDQQLETLA